MKNATLLSLVACSVAIAGTPANASSNDQERALVVSASVRGFCRISQESGTVTLNGRRGDLGLVREACNSASGYRVVASFANLKEGRVFNGADDALVAEDGTVSFDRTQASKIDHRWSIRDAVVRDASAPIYLQISVSPL